MVKSSVKTVTYTSGSRRANAARSVVANARKILRGRMVASPRAPLRTGGFYGVYNGRRRDELKFVDTTISITPFTLVGAISLLNGVTQGTDFNNRIGRSVNMKSLLFRFTVEKATGANSDGATARVILFYDAQTNGAAPVVTDVLATADHLAPMNLNNRDRFKILADCFIETDAFVNTTGVISAGTYTERTKTIYKKMNTEMQFSGTTNAVGSIATGGVFALFISSELNGTGYKVYSRIRFTDK